MSDRLFVSPGGQAREEAVMAWWWHLVASLAGGDNPQYAVGVVIGTALVLVAVLAGLVVAVYDVADWWRYR